MTEPQADLSWWEFQWPWVLGSLLAASILMTVVENLALLVLPEILSEALGTATGIAVVVSLLQFHGDRSRLRRALRDGMALFILWTPFLVLVEWALRAIKEASA